MRRLLGMLMIAAGGVLSVSGATNLVQNPSFEKQDSDQDLRGWRWEAGRANATIELDTGRARSGDRSIRIVNEAARAAHVYSSLSQSVQVKPNTSYTLSCYVWHADGGAAWIGGGDGWKHRFQFPRNTTDWVRVTGTLETAADESVFVIRILTESPTSGLWVDDVQLEEGATATSFTYVAPLAPGESRLSVEAVSLSGNLVPNPSFEVVDGVRPKDWMWDSRNTDATLTVETENPHSGSVCLKFTNGTPFGAHVYGWFGAVGGIPVEPATTYTLSAYVRSTSSFRAWFGGGTGWKVRTAIPNTEGAWQQVDRIFTTGPEETTFPLMVVVESPTEGFWLDDLCLRQGSHTLPPEMDAADPSDVIRGGAEPPPTVTYRGTSIGTRWAPSFYPPASWAFCTDLFKASGSAAVADPGSETIIQVRCLDEDGRELAVQQEPFPRDSRLATFLLTANISEVVSPELVLESRLLRDGSVVAQHRQTVNLVTPARIESRLEVVESLREDLRGLVARLEAAGSGAYARSTLTVLESFVPWARRDIVDDRPDRAWHAANRMVTMAEAAIGRARATADGTHTAPRTPRYRTSPIEIDGPSFLAQRSHADGRREVGPVFFTGYGHFSQVRQDIEQFPRYGLNFCQIEFGPRSVLVGEDRYDDRAIDEFLAVCDRAAAAGVSVNLLLSPHYFPDWALEKWPHLKECRGGFFKYCLHAPEARQVIEASLRYVIPRIKDHPALHSLCLSNEPISTDLDNCQFVADQWRAWLRRKHGDSDSMNRCWDTEYESFEDVPVPSPFPRTAQSVDFVRFNQEIFAGFHRWMADVIHEMAPGVPVHAKIMMGAHFRASGHGMWSVSPQLFGELSQIHGNDCVCMVSRRGEWANGWLMHQMAYDFQRSMGDKPVFNSENHVIHDRDHRDIPPEHLYSVLWQGALHGQSATTLWVWQRTANHTSSLEGSVIHRPACAEAVGHCNLDLNRFAWEMRSLQQSPPQIVFLWSQTSVIHSDDHYQALQRCYRSANFLGVPIGFVTDRQLEEFAEQGAVPPVLAYGGVRVLIVPEARCVSDGVLAGLSQVRRRGIPVLTAGPSFSADEYGRQRRDAGDFAVLSGYDADEERCFRGFIEAASGWQLSRPLMVAAVSGGPMYGVESRSTALEDGRIIASLCNHRADVKEVLVQRAGRPVVCTDLLTDEVYEGPIKMLPMRPRLVVVTGKAPPRP